MLICMGMNVSFCVLKLSKKNNHLQEEPWHETLEEYTFVQDCDEDTLHQGPTAPAEKSDCEVKTISPLNCIVYSFVAQRTMSREVFIEALNHTYSKWTNFFNHPQLTKIPANILCICMLISDFKTHCSEKTACASGYTSLYKKFAVLFCIPAAFCCSSYLSFTCAIVMIPQ